MIYSCSVLSRKLYGLFIIYAPPRLCISSHPPLPAREQLTPSRLNKTSAQPVTTSNGSDTNKSDKEEGDGDQNPLDPSKRLGGHVLVAVDEVRVGAVLSSTVSGSKRGGTGGPEDPAGYQ